MSTQHLRRPSDDTRLLTTPAGLERLLGLMVRWWDGWSFARLARDCGLSRQRVGRLLAQVGCTRQLWCQADHERRDGTRRTARGHGAQARAALLHPMAGRLTIRQRAALAWQAQGLASADIARRMHTTPQNVRLLCVAGQRRLERLSRARPSRSVRRMEGRPAAATPPLGDEGLPPIGWDELLAEVGAPPPLPQRPCRANGAAVGNAGPRGGTLVPPGRPATPRGQTWPSGGQPLGGGWPPPWTEPYSGMDGGDVCPLTKCGLSVSRLGQSRRSSKGTRRRVPG